jgi:NADP-dependent aldehyde dehydrogenase
MQINGAALVGSNERQTAARFGGDPSFSEAGPAEVQEACVLAESAARAFAELDPEQRARFLETAAANIDALGDLLIERAMGETGLPRPRLEGERARTIGQLRLFAQVVRQGDWVDATIDPAMPERAPLPRPDLRRRNIPVGPVAVFGASNFPLAFSVAGGDTASAFSAGCPVVVKGHPAHPGTGELVARAVRDAVAACGLPEGVFSYLPGTTNALGGALVADPRIMAVGFTGSRGGGLALVQIAAARPVPIPVFAEMSSINPVLLFPGAAKSRGDALGRAFIQSLTMGAGQFCTNPGLVIAVEGPELDAFVDAAQSELSGSQAQPMLTPAIHAAYEKGVAALSTNPSVRMLGRGYADEGDHLGCAALFSTTAAEFQADPTLAHEVFGASSLIISAKDWDEAHRLLSRLEGQLTVTLLFDDEDLPIVAPLMPLLEAKAGRILGNGWPTGVEVSHAMVHGGPFPATSDSRTTSVGTLAIQRFLRPVCYQNLPDSLLPVALRSDNPWHLSRRIDGIREPAD